MLEEIGDRAGARSANLPLSATGGMEGDGWRRHQSRDMGAGRWSTRPADEDRSPTRGGSRDGVVGSGTPLGGSASRTCRWTHVGVRAEGRGGSF